MIGQTVAFREAAHTGRLAFLNTGTGVAAINIYDGVRPASVNDVPAGVLLTSIPLAVPAGSIASGSLSLTAADAGFIVASGVATWARVVNRAGATAFDMDAGEGAAVAECILSDTTLFAGGNVRLVSAVLG